MLNSQSISHRDWRRMVTRYALLWLACSQMVLWWGEWTNLFSVVSSLAYPALLLWTFSLPVVQTLWNSTGRPARMTAAGLLVLMVNAQLVRRDELTYPFSAWTMYCSRRPDALEFADLIGMREDGTSFRLSIEELAMATKPFVYLLNDYHAQTIRIAATAPEEAAKRRAVMETMLVKLGQGQVRHAGESAVTRVELVRRTLGPDGAITNTTVLVAVNLPPAEGGPK